MADKNVAETILSRSVPDRIVGATLLSRLDTSCLHHTKRRAISPFQTSGPTFSLVKLTANITHFDLPLLVQAFDDPRESIRVQLSRWNTQGKIIGLRRGVYTLAEP